MTTIKEDIDNILGMHFSGEKLSSQQEAILKEWITDHPEEYNKLSNLLRNAAGTSTSATPAFDAEKAWMKVEAKLKARHRFRISPILAYAASILLLVGFALFWLNPSDEKLLYANTGDTNQMIWLPDSSNVTLYPGSQMHYIAESGSSERKVSLSGKAFFQVKRNEKKPFIVENRDVRIMVLGTSFLVSGSEDRNSEISVKEGLVQVTTSQEKVLLTANEQALVNGQEIDKRRIENPEMVFKGHIKSINYINTSLKRILQDVEKEFGIHIRIDASLETNRISTNLKITNIDDILAELSYICNCQFKKIADKQYYFYQKQ